MKKLSKKLLLLPITVSGMLSVAITSIGMLVKNNVENKVSNSIQNSSENVINNTSDKKELSLSHTNYYNPKLSANTGPIVYWGSTIISLDWFASKRWSLTAEEINKNSSNNKKILPIDGYHTSWSRPWLNMDLDRENNILYLLGNRGNDVDGQWVVAIDINNGRVINKWNFNTSSHLFAISALASGNVMVFGDNAHASTQHVIIDVKKNTITTKEGNLRDSWKRPEPQESDKMNEDNDLTKFDYKDSKNYIMNLIPIAPNRNFAVAYNMTSASGTSNDDGRFKGNSQVEFFLCDDEMKVINSVSEEWKKPKLITKAITGTRNSKIWPQRDYYKLLDGRVVTIIYDKLIVIDPRNPNNPELDIKTIKKDKWVESWTFDTNNNIFAKLRDDSVIWKIELRKGNNIISNYFDLKNTSNSNIDSTANTMSIYNVHGYSGQIMTINNHFTTVVEDESKLNSEIKDKNLLIGLSVAITKNATADTGDLKGLLNTNEAFQKSVDFDVKNESLNSKLPSEISRDDLDIKNEGFLTKNKDKDRDGNLLYPQITKTEVVDDDNKKKLSITVNLDQIPWFVSNGKMPKDIKPTKITKIYENSSFKETISSRFTWSPIENDYDFKNTLPSKMDLEYINKLNPLISTLQSQRVSINGKTYPSVEYIIKDKNDSTGEITIGATYKYLPMEQRAIDSNIKSYETSKKFTIFKSSDQKKFQFVGNQSQTDVSNIPELKEIKESNTLPSYFNNVKDKREFLKFIDVENTKGFPLEKVDIKAIGDDVNGTLTITVDSSKYDGNRSVYTKQFTGLNKKQSYKMSFKEPDKSKFDKLLKLPSQVNEEDIYLYFLNYDGFDPKDFNVLLSPNDINGQLGVTLKLNKNFPESALKEGTEFVKQNDGSFVAFKQFSGFKTNEEFQKEYQVIFKDVSKLDANKDKDLIELMKLSPSYIENQLKTENGGIKIGNTTYNDVKSLSKLFIESTGEKIPKDFDKENTNVKGELFINNSAGEITIKLTFEKLDGYPNAISFVKTFAGFAKGNDIATEDVLIFYDDNLFFVVNPEYKNKKPSELKEQLEKDKKEIKKFFSMPPTGDYKTAIDGNNFELEVVSDDNNGSLIITIKFKRGHITNKDSLLEYSQVYTGFSSY